MQKFQHRRLRGVGLLTSLVLSLLAFRPAPASASIFGDVRGVVLDPQERPVPRAKVSLQSRTSSLSQSTETSDAGEYLFRAVPLGDYVMAIEVPGFEPARRTVTVTSDSAPMLKTNLRLAKLAQSVDVVERSPFVGSDSPTTTTMVSRDDIARAPGADRSNSLAMITNNVPGAYMIHDQLHVRGGHQVTWLVDGVPIPNTNIASNVGPQIDPKDIDYLEVQRGGYSAEFGDRTYAIFNVVPRTGFEYDREAEVVASYGSFGQTNDQVRLGGHGDRLAYYASVSANRTDFGLATPTADVLHDGAHGLGAFTSFVYRPRAADQIRLVAAVRGDRYEVPNDADAQAAGTADIASERDAFVNLSWVRTMGRALLTVSPFYHFNRGDFLGGANDRPLVATDKHSSRYAGGQAVFSILTSKHKATAGLFGFLQHDETLFGLRPGDASGPGLEQQQGQSGNLEAAFVEDQYRPTDWLTLTGGVRFTHFAGSITEDRLTPRVGASVRIPRVGWTARAFYGRYYQAPPLATVSGPLLDFALDEGFGFLPLRGERDEEYQAGLLVPIKGWTIDADYFRNAARDFFDHDALADSNIFLPLTIERALIRGFEVAVKSPRVRDRARLSLSYSLQRAEGRGGVTGGLTDFSPPEDGTFLLDHDQRHTLNAGLDVVLPWKAYVAGAVHYGSGFADGETLGHLPGHVLFDAALGKAFGTSWSVAVHALNVANRRFLLDNSSTFGGTHYVDPRQVYAEVRYRFHY